MGDTGRMGAGIDFGGFLLFRYFGGGDEIGGWIDFDDFLLFDTFAEGTGLKRLRMARNKLRYASKTSYAMKSGDNN